MLVAMVFTIPAFAFDSTVWLEKRSALREEAARLKAAYAACSVRINNPAEDVVVPVETFDDGTVKTIVKARQAQYFHFKNLVWAKDVTVFKYAKDGSVKAKLVASSCVIDRLSKSGWAEGVARLEYGDTVFTGEGVYFSSPEGYVSVLEKADIVSNDLTFGGVDK